MRKSFDPLDRIPSPEAIRNKLQEVEQTAARLRVLLRVSEEIASAAPPRQDARPAEGRRDE